MSDKRWTWENKCIMLKQRSDKKLPQKIGLPNKNNWIAYQNNDHLFVKKVLNSLEKKEYPDFGCSSEVFTNHLMLELETLSPLTKLQPNGCVEHKEEWFLFDKIPTPQNEKDIDKFVMPIINSIFM